MFADKPLNTKFQYFIYKMANWQGALAAVGGIIALMEWIPAASPPLYATIGGVIALVFGILAAYSN